MNTKIKSFALKIHVCWLNAVEWWMCEIVLCRIHWFLGKYVLEKFISGLLADSFSFYSTYAIKRQNINISTKEEADNFTSKSIMWMLFPFLPWSQSKLYVETQTILRIYPSPSS